tara:strand:+ start:809 stop:1276 length:468 start_codon:yes stop_codon:yes gene_type:complete
MDILINRLNKIKEELNASIIWKKVFSKRSIQDFIIDNLLQDNQLRKSITGLNQPIRDKVTGSTTYAILTEVLTNGRKKAGDPYNLYDSGDFYNSMIVLLGNKFFEIKADPIKENANLYNKYGEEIIWLSEDSKDKLRERLKEEYRIELRNILLYD